MTLPVLTFVLFCCCRAGAQERYDVIIQEIMPDPSPAVGLPSPEWIEVRNRSKGMVNLQGWRVADINSVSAAMPSYLLAPDSILIICATAAMPSLAVYGHTLGIGSFPSLDNDGDVIRLLGAGGSMMHAVQYDPGWLGNELKKEGGWSIEMIDPAYPCTGKGNWRWSEDPAGGTPGSINSVSSANPDDRAPVLLRAYTLNDTIIRLVFNETVDSLKASLLTAYNNSDVRSGEAFPIAPLFNEVELHLVKPMTRGTIYNITSNGICDCAGNAAGETRVRTGIPAVLGKASLVINEILFNPAPNGSDYVELFNAGDSLVDLGTGYLANRNSAGDLAGHVPLAAGPYLFFPGDYYVLTTDPEQLAMHFFSPVIEHIHVIPSMPSFPDDKGVVAVTGPQGGVADEVSYSDKWHFPLIRQTEGVALERVGTVKGSQDPSNWHSASSSSGYGTPGYRNSQTEPDTPGDGAVVIRPGVFSPDNDGTDDQCFIYYNLPSAGFVADVRIYNVHGVEVRRLVSGGLLAASGSWPWDGLNEKGQANPPGPYIILTTLFNLDGRTSKSKLLVVLAHK